MYERRAWSTAGAVFLVGWMIFVPGAKAAYQEFKGCTLMASAVAPTRCHENMLVGSLAEVVGQYLVVHRSGEHHAPDT